MMIKKIILLTVLVYNVFSAAFEEERTFSPAEHKIERYDDKRVYSLKYRIVTSPNTLKKVTVSTDYGSERAYRRIVKIEDLKDTFGNITDDLCKRLFAKISKDFLDNGDLQFLFFSVENVKKGSSACDQLERLGFKACIYNPDESQYPLQFVEDKGSGSSPLITLGAHKKAEKLQI